MAKDRDDQWEQGYVPGFMPSIQKKIMNADPSLTQEKIDKCIGIASWPGLKEAIKEATEETQYASHITEKTYDPTTGEYGKFINNMVPPANMVQYVPDEWQTVVAGHSRGTQSSSNNSGDWSPSSPPAANASPAASMPNESPDANMDL